MLGIPENYCVFSVDTSCDSSNSWLYLLKNCAQNNPQKLKRIANDLRSAVLKALTIDHCLYCLNKTRYLTWIFVILRFVEFALTKKLMQRNNAARGWGLQSEGIWSEPFENSCCRELMHPFLESLSKVFIAGCTF